MLVAGMIVLNEERFIGLNLAQHYDWLDRIVIVEGADRHYPHEAVTEEGLSRDRTAEIVRDFPDAAGKIQFIQHGWAGDDREGSGKVELRQRYAAELRQKAIFLHLDADEFYTRQDQKRIGELVRQSPRVWSFEFPQVHYWRDLTQIIVGGYYSIRHLRLFRKPAGASYRWTSLHSHNWPRTPRRGLGPLHWGGKYLKRYKPRLRFDADLQQRPDGLWYHPGIACYHLGFCRSGDEIAAKNQYYARRGETRSQPETTRSRALFFDPSKQRGEKVLPWGGAIPEACADLAPAS